MGWEEAKPAAKDRIAGVKVPLKSKEAASPSKSVPASHSLMGVAESWPTTRIVEGLAEHVTEQNLHLIGQ